MATSKLKIYNGALRCLGQPKLSALTDAAPARYLLDEVFDDGGLDYVLEQGLWNHAMRASKLEPTPSVTPAFGYNNAYEKPEDMVRIAAMSENEHFSAPLLYYVDEVLYWFTNASEIYIQYVSKSTDYGYDYSLWPETFTRYVESWFASQICESLTQSETKWERLSKDTRRLLVDARSKDAMKGPTRFLPSGRFVQSRGGGGGSDGGTMRRLTG